ncbi:MAG TPA: glycoside hydrolase family 2 TIM barrel-domain containing protein, partial [Polyangia bacterium]|nr:glycoside hydrolase family 2 TIM barrel-domain containing protein [Polyangia bacterium]
GSGAAGGTGAGGASGAGGTAAPRTAVYNGLRGQDFNTGWKFNRGDVTGAQATTFNDASWRSLDLPHDWSIELAFNSNSPAGAGGGFLDGGVGWYRKSFTLDASASGKRILIDFDGVYMNSQVWVNGTSLGTRPYGYTTFEYDLTPYVKLDGSANVVAVRVNNNQPNSRFYSGSGIYRNVWLTTLNAVHVPWNGVFVAPTVSGGAATVAVSSDVENLSAASASVVVTTTVTAPDGTVAASNDSAATAVAAGATTTVKQSLTVASPQLWSPSAPALYQVRVDVKVGGAVVDSYLTAMGLRTEAFSATSGFSLNGQAMKIRGVNMHHDLGALGSAVNYRAIERQVQILKAMGVNAIRTAHNPPAPELLDITDRLGMLVLDEAFDTWTTTKTANDYGLYFATWAQRDIQDMVKRDRNHPSVILWSIGNEVSGSTTATATNLKNWVLAMDPTRPITWASNKMGGPHVSEGDDRDVAALLDVQGYNYAPYAGDWDADHSAHPTWKLLGTETSAAVRSRGIYHTPASTITKATSQSSPDRQCSSYDNEAAGFGDTAESSYTYDASRAFVAGSFIWSGFDYIGEPTPYASYPSKSSYYGAIDTAGFPKDVYYFYQSRWTTTPVVHILPHWNWSAGTTVTVYVYNNCDSVELFLNGASQGVKSMGGGALHAQWSVPWASGTLRADCTRGGSVVASDQMATAGAAAKIALSADRATINADGHDLVFVTGDIKDGSGVEVPTAANAVTFSVTGPGQLVGVDNGNPIDTASYKGTSRNAFSGKVLAIVRSTGAAGTITVGASASGLTAGSVAVTAR